jgi:NADH-quinone oxidoreductase subunit J
LILFVIMLLGVDQEEDIYTEPLVGQRTVAAVVAFGLFIIVFGILMIGGTRVVTGTPNCKNGQPVVAGDAYQPGCDPVDPAVATAGDQNNVQKIGRLLFTDWAFAFEITAALLTIAVVGAVVLARKPTDVQPIPDREELSPGDSYSAYDSDGTDQTERGRA